MGVKSKQPPVTRTRQKVLEILGSESGFLPQEIRLGLLIKEYQKSEDISQIQLSEELEIR